MYAPLLRHRPVARIALAMLLSVSLSLLGPMQAIAAANPPVALAGVDFLPSMPPALYPGGTAFAGVSMDGAKAIFRVMDAAGSTLAIPGATCDSRLLAWDGRDVDGTSIRAGNARLEFQYRKEIHMTELRPQRRSMRAPLGVNFMVGAIAR